MAVGGRRPGGLFASIISSDNVAHSGYSLKGLGWATRNWHTSRHLEGEKIAFGAA